MAEPRRITLLTDFGTADGYVAAMKGVIAARAPHAIVDDAAHDIPPGDIAAAAWALGAYWRRYPSGTIHVAVVDPGVGSPRQALALLAADRVLVAPDNGVLTHVLRETRPAVCVAIDPHRLASGSISATFHGRDVFAPAAALLANGVSFESLGAATRPAVLLDAAATQWDAVSGSGVVVHVDHFGNLITNIPAAAVAATALLELVAGSAVFPLQHAYADVPPGDPVAVIGSRGTIELSLRGGSAAGRFGLARGTPVKIRQ